MANGKMSLLPDLPEKINKFLSAVLFCFVGVDTFSFRCRDGIYLNFKKEHV